MHRLTWFGTFVVLLTGTLSSGWVHGRLANRWGDARELETAAQRLDRPLPQRLGPWRLLRSQEVEASVREVLQAPAALQGAYTHDQTGDTVMVTVVVGPGGPISVHTPEICYAGQDYALLGRRQRVAVRDRDGREHSFWSLVAEAAHPSQPTLQVLYGWRRHGVWQATDGPRFAFAGVPVLYKLQLAAPRSADGGEPRTDPGQDFLSHFVADLESRLGDSSPPSVPAP